MRDEHKDTERAEQVNREQNKQCEGIGMCLRSLRDRNTASLAHRLSATYHLHQNKLTALLRQSYNI